MPTRNIHVVTILPTIGGDPLDFTRVGFHFTVDAGEGGSIGSMVSDFFTAAHGTQPVGAYLGGQLSRSANAGFIEQYDVTGHLDGSPHGGPIGEITTFTLPAPVSGLSL